MHMSMTLSLSLFKQKIEFLNHISRNPVNGFVLNQITAGKSNLIRLIEAT